MQVCMVCMYACVHIGVHCWQDGVSLRGRNMDGNPFVWVCRMETPRMGLSRVILKTREDGSENRFLSRVRSAAKRECEP